MLKEAAVPEFKHLLTFDGKRLPISNVERKVNGFQMFKVSKKSNRLLSKRAPGGSFFPVSSVSSKITLSSPASPCAIDEAKPFKLL